MRATDSCVQIFCKVRLIITEISGPDKKLHVGRTTNSSGKQGQLVTIARKSISTPSNAHVRMRTLTSDFIFPSLSVTRPGMVHDSAL